MKMDIQILLKQHSRAASLILIYLSSVSQFYALDPVSCSKTRFPKHLNWDGFVATYKDKPFFKHHFRMSYDSFILLLNKIKGNLPQIDAGMAARRGGSIIHEVYLYATICYLAGGLYSNICIFCGISVGFFIILWGKLLV